MIFSALGEGVPVYVDVTKFVKDCVVCIIFKKIFDDIFDDMYDCFC